MARRAKNPPAESSETECGTLPVSASHLVTGDGSLNAFEFGLIMASHAFNRWMVRCMTAAGLPELGSLDVLVLHQVNHRERAKRLSDICFVLNIEDSHTVTYSLKKLLKLELVESSRQGKEAYYATTDGGRSICETYRAIRNECLVDAAGAWEDHDLESMAKSLRALSGLYDQGARTAASL